MVPEAPTLVGEAAGSEADPPFHVVPRSRKTGAIPEPSRRTEGQLVTLRNPQLLKKILTLLHFPLFGPPIRSQTPVWYFILWGNLKEGDRLEHLRVDEEILKWFFKKSNELAWIGFIWLRMGTIWRDIVSTVMNIRVA